MRSHQYWEHVVTVTNAGWLAAISLLGVLLQLLVFYVG